MKYTYDVFIAYHGTFSPDGSYEKAKELELFFTDQGLKPYIFKEETGENWTDALRHIQESKTMLVVLNSGVLRDDLGRISAKRSSGEPYQLYEEIEHFRSFVSSGEKNFQTINFLYVGDDKDAESARAFCIKLVPEICPRLNNIMAAEKDSLKILAWIKSAINLQSDVKRNSEESVDSGALVDSIINGIVNDLMRRNCVIVLGPLVNDNYKNFLGNPNCTFFEKSRSFHESRGATALGREIENFSQKEISPSVRHLAKLPFTAYITTVEYTKISEALQSSNRQSVLISSPESIYGLDLQKGEIPVFELNRSNIYSDDCIIQEGLSCEILKMILTGRKILYVGYDQNYKGYEAVALALKNILGGDYVPLNNIVVADMQENSQLFISNENFSCLNLPIDDFVGRLIANKTFSKTFRYDGEESKFISDLFNIASTPTETQAIELFLKQLLEDVASDLSIDEIVRKANLNCENLKKIKGNFNAFVKCWQSIKKEIGESPTKRKLTSSVDAYQWRRRQITMGVQNQGEEYGIAPKRILLFSESLRVVEFLTGTSDEFQQESSLFICECRPKSEYPFQDAKNMCALLKENGCRFKSITIIPDMAAFNLLERHLIDVVILGAHDVLFYEGNPVHFINTCGSSALIETAINNSVEVVVVAERGKFNTITSTNESVVTGSSQDSFVYAISYGHESTIYDDYEFMLWAENESIGTKNIGYDFCAFHKGMRLICEDEVFDAEESDLKIRLVDRTKD